MRLIQPFAALRPLTDRAVDVVAPPYDVLNTEEARQRADGREWSFLHISKPEIDLPLGTDPFDPSVYAKGAENLQRMIGEGVLARDDQPCYYVYRLIMGEHEQTGLVAAASVMAYDQDLIKKHEFTRPDKEDDRVRQIDALDGQTGPVLLTYRASDSVDGVIAQVVNDSPVADVTADDGVRHIIWVVRDASQIETISQAFESQRGEVSCLYVADGHHRSAAASRIAAMRAEGNASHQGDEPYNSFLTVMFAAKQMKILDYNRVIKDLNGRNADTFMAEIGARFDMELLDGQAHPEGHGQFCMYLQGGWYRLTIHEERVPSNDPVASLDVSLLQNNLIDPLLGIQDPRRDKRIDFVGGIRGLEELSRRVDSGEMAVAFALYPTTMADLMAVADAGEVMPPKSTWFEPKLADGLISHMID